MISVIMPVYNGSKYLSEAINSILNQTFPEFELIIVDDGSTDDSVLVIKKYMDQDDRVHLYQNQHGGACRARNTAIDHARFEWIAAMDADDIAIPERLAVQYEHSQADPEVVVWGTYMYRVDANEKRIGVFEQGPTSKEAFYKLDRTQEIISLYNPTAMFKRDIALKVGGYDPRLVAGQDSELWDRMAEYGPIVVIPQHLLCYRVHGSSISTKKLSQQKMLLEFPPARYRARQQGKELSLQQFLADYNDLSSLAKFSRAVHNQSDVYYRKAIFARVEDQRIKAIMYHLMGALLRPGRTIANTIKKLTNGG
ncbi:MAG: glycosyltransferase family A protein [Aggregatilineales bacterium]